MNKATSLLASLALVLSGGLFISCSDDDDAKNLEFGSGDFVVSKTEIAIAGTGQQTLTVKSPVKPSVSSDASWLHVGTIESAKSSSIYTVPVWCDENTAFDVRSGNITVTAGSQTRTVAVTQYGAETVEIKALDPGADLKAEGGNLTVTFAATGDVTVKAPEWLKEVKSKALVENKVQYTYSANYSEADRSGDIVISLVSDPAISKTVTVKQPKMEASSDMSDDAKTLAKKMFAGVNIGNTMECPEGEGAWSGAKVNEDYIKGLKALGFNAVRIPCAWDSHVTDKANNTIDPAWLDRVNEVVGWIVANDMYAILNIHWDGGWLESTCSNGYDEAVNKKQRDYWTQIATKLNHFDQHLLFAGMNEPGMQNGTEGNAIDAIMKYQQTFLDAVRATGGNNATRCLIHQAPSTNIDLAVAGAYKLPKDVVDNRMFVEVHQYDPSDYTIMESDGQWSPKVKLYWGSKFHLSGSDRNCTWGEEDHIDNQFKKVQDKYVSAGIPVIVGEYSVSVRNTTAFPDMDVELYKAGRAYWNEYLTASAKNHGCVPFYWETGGDISRSKGTAINAYAIDALIKGAKAGNYPF